MRNLVSLFLVLLGIADSSSLAAETGTQEATGTLQGHALFDGGPLPKGINVADTVIYLTGDGLASRPVPAQQKFTPILDQRDIAFVPHVLPVMAGTKVEIRNSDAILHNVHTTCQKNPPFNRAQLGNKTFETVFQAPEIIRVVCDIHSQMSAYIVVIPTPYFTKAAKGGSFTLKDIPPGKYQLVAWHEKYGAMSREIEIDAGKVIQADMNLTRTSKIAKETSL